MKQEYTKKDEQVIRVLRKRCKQCAGGIQKSCYISDCPLYKFFTSKNNPDPIRALKHYCKDCLNGNDFEVCSSEDCPIYIYRNKHNI